MKSTDIEGSDRLMQNTFNMRAHLIPKHIVAVGSGGRGAHGLLPVKNRKECGALKKKTESHIQCISKIACESM